MREARESRGLTSSALADLTQLAPSTISHYEHGRYVPSHETTGLFSDKLSVPVHFFFKQSRLENPNRLVFWRSNKAAKQLERKRVERRFDWFVDTFYLLSEWIQFPEPDLPGFNTSICVTDITMEEIEQIASKLRIHWGLGDGPIPNLISMMEYHGCVLTRMHMDAAYLDAFSEWQKESDRPFFALGSDKTSEARSLFNAAHELGHMILHRNSSLREYNTASTHKEMEKQADYFASCFLMPAESFTSELHSVSLDSFRNMKHSWRVSIQSMIMRSSQLGLISSDEKTRLFIGLNRRGWRKNEPGDEESIPEQPKLLKHAIDTLRDSDLYTPDLIESRLGLSTFDIESVTGLPNGYLRSEPENPYKLQLVR